MSGEKKVKRHVHRPAAHAQWEHEHRWGTMISDSTTLYVRRTDGGSLSIAYGQGEIEIRAELVQVLAEMVAEAAAWTDEQPVGGESA